MKMRYWLILSSFVLAACQKDPFYIKNLGDGSGSDWNFPDGGPPPEWGTTDGKTEFPVPDISYDACIARIEVCNNVDDNCDGVVDEGLDKDNVPAYCENCKGCKWMTDKNAFPGCSGGKCVIASCMGGWIDANNDPSDGCEYQCTPTGVEVCDGIDNDCDKQVDKTAAGAPLAAPAICLGLGPCAGAVAECKGSLGWICNYDVGQGVELQPCQTDDDCGKGYGFKCDKSKNVCLGRVITNETKCDGKDGDCDGCADDPWGGGGATCAPNGPTPLGKECELDNPPKKGICRNVGTWACNTAQTGTICQLSVAGLPAAAESCNGLDDNCDGVVDNLDPANAAAEVWITVGGFQIFAYEASRPDANASAAGIQSTGRACSVSGRLPWASVTKEDALAACQKAGARLCTTAEWEQACRGTANTNFPYGNTYDATKCNGKAYDADPGTAGDQDIAMVTDLPATCLSSWGGAGTIHNLSGNVKEWTKTGGTYEIKGGAFDTPSIDGYGAGLSCDYDLPAPAATLILPTLGFRCCK